MNKFYNEKLKLKSVTKYIENEDDSFDKSTIIEIEINIFEYLFSVNLANKISNVNQFYNEKL